MLFIESGAETVVQGPQPAAINGLPLTVGLAGGNYVVVWLSADGDFLGDVQARIYNHSGTPLGSAFTIFNDVVNFELPHNFDLIALPNGGFAVSSLRAVTLNSDGNRTETSDIILQYFSATGVATSPVISASTTSGSAATTYVSQPELSVAGDRLVLVWDGGDAGGTPLNGRVFDLSGNAITPPFTVDNGSSGLVLQTPAVATFANGSFLAVWREGVASNLTTAATGDIRAQLFDVNGNAMNASFIVNSNLTGVQNLPHVSVLANGNAIVTWGDLATGTMDIHGQLLSSTGARIGGEVTLATTGQTRDTNGFDYGLTALHDGGFALAWSDAVDNHIYVREFGSTGIALRGETSVSNGEGFFPHIDALAGGGYEVVWSNNATQTVYAQTIDRAIFDSASPPVVSNFNPGNGWTSQNQFPRHVADLNGDGYNDVVGFGWEGVLVSYGSASGTFSGTGLVLANFGQTEGWTNDNQFHRAVADLSGDGRADVIGFGYAGTLVSLTGADGSFGTVTTGLSDFGVNQGWTSQDGFARLTGDVNGDGKADIIGFGYAGTLVALGTGDGNFEPINLGVANFGVNQGWTSDNIFHRELADVNGDGKADIVGFGIAGTYVALSNGDGTFADAKLDFRDFGTDQGWSSNDSYYRIVADVNGDQLADIIGFTSAGALIAFGNGDGTFDPVRMDVSDFGRNQGWTSDNTFHRELADMNQDGFLDVVGFGIAGVLVGQNHIGYVF